MFKSSQCSSCERSRGDGTCDAFPRGIPEEVSSGEISHVTNIPGDRGFTYKKKGGSPGVFYAKGGPGSGDKPGHEFHGNQYSIGKVDGITFGLGVGATGTVIEALDALKGPIGSPSNVAKIACLPPSITKDSVVKIRVNRESGGESEDLDNFLERLQSRASSHYGVSVSPDEVLELLTNEDEELSARQIWPNLDAVRGTYNRIISSAGPPKIRSVELVVKNEKIFTERTLEFDKFGNVEEIHCEFFVIKDRAAIEERGTSIFHDMVRVASDNGVKKLTVFAGGAPKDSVMNGYYTWARLGYSNDYGIVGSAPAPPEVKGVIGENRSIVPAGKLHLVMSTQEGREWWKNHGEAFDGTFDLRPHSRSMKILNEYMREKHAKGK